MSWFTVTRDTLRASARASCEIRSSSIRNSRRIVPGVGGAILRSLAFLLRFPAVERDVMRANKILPSESQHPFPVDRDAIELLAPGRPPYWPHNSNILRGAASA